MLLKPVRSGKLKSVVARALDRNTATPITAPTKHKLAREDAYLNILVAEDNRTNQLIVKSMLKDPSIAITFASNGIEALSKYTEIEPDLILMDMSMPEMDGLAATRAIRKLERGQTTTYCPIIALTANAMPEDRDRCLEVGMDDFLSKPINKKALLDVLQKWGPHACSSSRVLV